MVLFQELNSLEEYLNVVRYPISTSSDGPTEGMTDREQYRLGDLVHIPKACLPFLPSGATE